LLHQSSVYISVATAWELAIKLASNKLELPVPVSKMAAVYGFSERLITFQHVELAAALPYHHRDPFDRLLVAQAQAERLILVTTDKKLARMGCRYCWCDGYSSNFDRFGQRRTMYLPMKYPAVQHKSAVVVSLTG
jgi:PIN domain nuclease of toxin-antitoxin system